MTSTQWLSSEALASVLLPGDETNYVVEADVVQYIDVALSTKSYKKLKKTYFAGLKALDKIAEKSYGASFSSLNSKKRDQTLQTILSKKLPDGSSGAKFIKLSLVLVLEGFLGDPIYGGNKNLVGWKMIGFEQHCQRPTLPYGQ